MRRFAKAVSALSAAAVLTVSLSACDASSDDQKKVAEELQGREFQDVKYVGRDEKTHDWIYSAKLDDCRLDIARDALTTELKFRATSPSQAADISEAIRIKAGGPVRDTVNASFVREYASELGLAHCLK